MQIEAANTRNDPVDPDQKVDLKSQSEVNQKKRKRKRKRKKRKKKKKRRIKKRIKRRKRKKIKTRTRTEKNIVAAEAETVDDVVAPGQLHNIIYKPRDDPLLFSKFRFTLI